MASTLKTIIPGGTQLTTTNPATTAISSAGAAERILISKVTFTNTTTTNQDITVWLLSSGTSPSATNYLFKKTLLPGKDWSSPQLSGAVFDAGAGLYANTTTANAVNVRGSGVSET